MSSTRSDDEIRRAFDILFEHHLIESIFMVGAHQWRAVCRPQGRNGAPMWLEERDLMTLKRHTVEYAEPAMAQAMRQRLKG